MATTTQSPRAALPWLAAATLTETLWITGIQQAHGPVGFTLTGIAVALSLALALRSTRFVAASTVYIAFTALGTLGAFVVDSLVRQALPSLSQTFCVIWLIASVIGLQRQAGR